MGCSNCGKNNARREASAGKTLYIKCPICGTLLHGRTKDMKKIDGNNVCGECYAKWKKMLALKKPQSLKDIGIEVKAPSEENRLNDLTAWKKTDNTSKKVKSKPECK